ncbi:hypothetical protein N8137_03025 [Porticoccaceae bacterium]|nr:hypothetical protein [Porticoccaceae bacterium]MDB9843041.1 hypothetical protein [Porticoccaceae bacterium]MDC0133844.1 hypothetical protein [Porticoccaceae bacterium]MDC1477073.1 hypothetical protein [Porticoccaceae bacterium]
MQHRLKFFYAVTLATVLSVAGCAVNPVTGKNELSLISPAQEIAMGEKTTGPQDSHRAATII